MIRVVPAPLSFIRAGFAGLSILEICELVDAFLTPDLARDDSNRLIVRVNR